MTRTSSSNKKCQWEVDPSNSWKGLPLPPPPPPPPPLSQPAAVKMILNAETDPEAMVQSLLEVVQIQKEKQQVIEEVHLTIDPSFYVGSLLMDQGRELMKSFGKISTLKRCIISGQFRAPFPVSVVSLFLSEVNATTLVQFSLFQMTLIGTKEEFKDFGLNVGRHASSLEVFDIDMMHLVHHRRTPFVVSANGDDDDEDDLTSVVNLPHALDPLLKALNESPNLRALLLGGCEASSLEGTVSSELVQELFRSKTIRRLSLVNVPLSLIELCNITKSLESNDCLKSLCLICGEVNILVAPETRADIPGVATAIASAYYPSAYPTKHRQEQYELRKASLSSMFKKNKTLEKLILFLPDLDQDEDLNLEIFRSVQESSTLKELYLGSFERMSPRSKEALLHMAQNNVVLEEFGFVCASEGVPVSSSHPCPCSLDTIREMTMLLRLNRDADRGKILQNDNSTRVERVEGLINVRDDIDCIFHLLSRQPTLMMGPESLEKKKGPTAKKRNARKRWRGESGDEITGSGIRSKRTRLYRAAKYKSISYR